jgi:hypothetical protein
VAGLNEKAGSLVVQGVNLSPGGGFDPSVFGCGHTPSCQELRRLWRPECQPTLRALCIHAANCEVMEGPWDIAEFAPLAALYQKHSSAMAELATKLRLTPKARFSARTADNEIPQRSQEPSVGASMKQRSVVSLHAPAPTSPLAPCLSCAVRSDCGSYHSLTRIRQKPVAMGNVKYFTHRFRHSWYGDEDTEVEDTFGREA